MESTLGFPFSSGDDSWGFRFLVEMTLGFPFSIGYETLGFPFSSGDDTRVSVFYWI